MTPAVPGRTGATPIPDPALVARALRAPDQGPRILFFTGGTALKATSQALVAYTHNSSHLVTPFDSGGSSAVLRRHFDMPAVGDLRSRLMALADRTQNGFPKIFDLFSCRLPKDADDAQLRSAMDSLSRGRHPLLTDIAQPMRGVISHHLRLFAREAGPGFDLRGASLGNLVLAAGYLEHDRCMEPIVSIYADLVQARGLVRLIVDANLHLQARLADGRTVVGQHLITGKEHPPLAQPVEKLCLVDPKRGNAPCRPPIQAEVQAAIRDADLVCYPMGSFYSSLVANLLPAGVGQAVSRTPSPKVFVPNTLPDLEAVGLSLREQVRTLLHHLRADDPGTITDPDVLDIVLLDPAVRYPGSTEPERDLDDLSVRVVRTPLTVRASGAVDPHLLCQALVSLTR